MKRWAWLLLLFSTGGGAQVAVTDDLGTQVALKSPARRIVTLAPFLTELAFAAGAGARLVGVSAHSDYPPEASTLPQVGSAVTLSLEQLVALGPDLVLAWNDSIRREDVERIRGLGIAVFVAQARRLADVPRLLGVIGRLTGSDVTARAGDYEARLASLRRAHAGKKRVEVFLEIWNRPLTTISGEHFMNDALELCGAANAFKDLVGVAPEVSWEALYRRDPAVIVGVGSAANEQGFQENWARHATLQAVREGRLVYVEADTLQRPTLRIPDGIAKLCARIDAMRIRLLVPRS